MIPALSLNDAYSLEGPSTSKSIGDDTMTILWCTAYLYVSTITSSSEAMPANGARQEAPAAISPQDSQVAGPFDLNNGLSLARKQETLATIRSFLWLKISEHHAAKLTAIFYTKEGDSRKYKFSVQADPTERWCVQTEILIETRFGLPEDHKPRFEKTFVMYCDVERIDAQSGQIIGKDETRMPETYKLRLRSAMGGASALTL